MQNILTVLFKLLALETPFPSASPSQVICAAELGAGKGRDGRRKRKPFTPPFQPEAKREPEAVTQMEEGQV